jgi:UDP-N-acetylglucosamine--N-acetylmuramyl-(pentapeptide) pyrophosphoryl-undecaprenol N-acetylglucosamine transferase
MRILFSGGGTLGPVTPLLAVAEALLSRADPVELTLFWIGTPAGPERRLVEGMGISFFSLSAPKFDRTRRWRIFLLPFHFAWALVRGLWLLKRVRPDAVMTAGGYVSVPVVLLAWLMGTPCWVHQQDRRWGLANKIMAPLAIRLSCAWETIGWKESARPWVVGNPVRPSLFDGDRARALVRWGFAADLPTLVVLGGGTGSSWINAALCDIALSLTEEINVLHLTGEGKFAPTPFPVSPSLGKAAYVSVEFVAEAMADAYALADVVLSRAGMGTISELAALGKPSIIVPIPDSHQTENAEALLKTRAAVVLSQTETTPEGLRGEIVSLFRNENLRIRLAAQIRQVFKTDGVAEALADGVLRMARREGVTRKENHA